MFVINREPAHRNVGGEKSDGDSSGNEVKEKRKSRDRAQDDSDEDGDYVGDGNQSGGEGEGGDEDEEMDDAPVMRFGPPKGRSRSGHVKSVTHHDHPDVATLASSVDGNIFIFVTFNLFLYFSF